MAVSMLSQVIEQSEDDETDQNGEVLGTVADYFMELAAFVNDSNVNISATVSRNFLCKRCRVYSSIVVVGS